MRGHFLLKTLKSCLSLRGAKKLFIFGDAMLETRKKTYSRRSITAAKPTTSTTRTRTEDDVNVVSETMRKRRGRRTNKEEDYELPLPDGKKKKNNAKKHKEEEERRRKKETRKKRVVVALFLICVSVGMILLISYLRLLIVPDAVRTKAMEHTQFLFPSWMNETFLNLLPALNPDVLNSDSYYNATEHLIAARQVSDTVERQTETSGGYRAGVRKHRIGAVEIKAVHSEKDAV